LRPGGKLIAIVPAFKFLWSWRDVQCHHVRRYTLKSFGASWFTAGSE
jgi:hypothetical protein